MQPEPSRAAAGPEARSSAPGATADLQPPNGSMAEHMWLLARRSVARTLRQPFVTVPILVFPLFFLAVSASGLEAATDLPEFPTNSYLTFALATAFVQAAMSAVMVSGGGLAEDIHSGFMSRLSLTRLHGAALVVGHLAGTVIIVLIGTVVYLTIGWVFGASVEAGVGGAIVLFPLMALIALAFGAVGVLAALLSPSAQAVQSVFPLLFVLLFLSSMNQPRNLIEVEWFRTVADLNPMSYLIEAPRSLLVTGWHAPALAIGAGVALVITVAMIVMSSRRLRTRLVRT